MNQQFHLTASKIRGYFKHRCERLLRYSAVPTRMRGQAGLGWNVPRRLRPHSRPGIQLLMEAGDSFERDQVDMLAEEHGREDVHIKGYVTVGGRQQVELLPLEEFVTLLQTDNPPRYIAQVDLPLEDLPNVTRAVLTRFGLDPDAIALGGARPDLVEIIPAENGGRDRLRIWDFKATQAARHEHFIQIAYYTFILEEVLQDAGLPYDVDTEFGLVYSFEGEELFELEPYRLALSDFLHHQLIDILNTAAADAHYLVHEKCMLCEYMTHCREEADAGQDLSRIAYISSESKRRLNEHGIRNHRELARLAQSREQKQASITELRQATHDLSVNLPRYLAAAEALETGRSEVLEAHTLLMPRWENIRIVLSAEQDAVTNSCFALAIKTYEGWDQQSNRPLGQEHIFIADQPDNEAEILLAFLQTLNGLLLRIDEQNRTISERPYEEEPTVQAAQQQVTKAEETLAAFKAKHPRITKKNPRAEELKAHREQLKQAVKDAKSTLKQANKDVSWERFKAQQTVHFYFYDTIDVLVIKSALERYLFDTTRPELLQELATLVRLFPPESLLPDADTYRTIPGTVVIQVLKAMVALPVPYLYDLASVSRLYRRTNRSGEEVGYVYRPAYGFGWDHSNQVAFERIHDVWRGQTFQPDSGNPNRAYSPAEIRDEIAETIRHKLWATDSIIQQLKTDLDDRLLLRKEPFRLHEAFNPLSFQMLEALRVFTALETAQEELAVKQTHTLSVEDRTAKFECISNLRYVEDGTDSTLWFTFDPAAVEAKFSEGSFNLVVTPQDDPRLLLADIDGGMINTSRWGHRNYQVSLVEYDLEPMPPRVRLRPDNLGRFREKLDLNLPFVLDRLYVDYNSRKVFDTLTALENDPDAGQHLHEILASAEVSGWRPFVSGVPAIKQRLINLGGGGAADMLNEAQWRAWTGVFQTPISLIWGPPGTGKSYTLAHILLGYILAAERLQRPVNILVTAFTHHAIVNVLKKVREVAERYRLNTTAYRLAKIAGYGMHDADLEIQGEVEFVESKELLSFLDSHSSGCTIVGSTVWGMFRTMDKSDDGVLQPIFDVVLVDEASQMKLPDALIAFSASKFGANLILAGDDKQLPPIIHGRYPEEHEHMLTSIFAFVRERVAERSEHDPTAEGRQLFQLEENFRMNQPLTIYPSEMLYRGRFISIQQEIRMTTAEPLPWEAANPIDFLLHPERPVVLCSYHAPRSFTARNPLEAALVAALVLRLEELLVDSDNYEPLSAEVFANNGVGVLSPHRAQNSTIRRLLEEHGFNTDERPLPIVDTVDKLQGQEREVIFVSYGVADMEYAEAEAEFLLSSNRFNVAATRAKRKLIVFCSEEVLNTVPTEQKTLLESMMLKQFRSYCDSGYDERPWQSDEFGEVTLHIYWKGFGQ